MMIRSGSDEPLIIGVPPMTVFLVMIDAICFLHTKKSSAIIIPHMRY
jgi:hypothetical protein